MRRTLVAVVTVLAGVPCWPAFAADHLVSSTAQDRRLAEHAKDRASDVAALEEVLSSATAERAAASIGADLSRVRTAVPTLSDAELRDLAERARAVGVDPVAGLDHDIHQLLVIFLIVAIVILVLKAVD